MNYRKKDHRKKSKIQKDFWITGKRTTGESQKYIRTFGKSKKYIKDLLDYRKVKRYKWKLEKNKIIIFSSFPNFIFTFLPKRSFYLSLTFAKSSYLISAFTCGPFSCGAKVFIHFLLLTLAFFQVPLWSFLFQKYIIIN